MSAWVEFGFRRPARHSFERRREADSGKQGKFGSDAPAAGEAQYLCMRERANGADELKSPKYFPNRIRATWNRNKTKK